MGVDSGNGQPAVPETALQVWLAVHKDDMHLCDQGGAAPMGIYPGKKKKYIGLRYCKVEATERLVQVAGDPCVISKETMVLLSVRFSDKGFIKCATKALGADQLFETMLHKKMYPDNTKDWGVRAFHDLPLVDHEDRHLLISSEWMSIE